VYGRGANDIAYLERVLVTAVEAKEADEI